MATSVLVGALSAGCTSALIGTSPAPTPTCANLDWFEIGRSDGRHGALTRKFEEHRQRCEALGTPPSAELYFNGRELGLIDFCSPTGALEAGREGAANGKVCPENMQATFDTNYALGLRIRDLEGDENDLKGRIENMTSLLGPNSNSLKAQIEQLKTRRAQIDAQINQLESRASD